MKTYDLGTKIFNDPYRSSSLGGRARAKRWEMLLRVFPDLPDMAVLDLGGTSQFWNSMSLRPKKLVILNIDATNELEISGDACAPPESVRSERFDLVISNSVIEHVGGHWRRAQFSRVVQEMAPKYWVQTPYRYFPIEPHWLFPGFQFLPFRMRLKITQLWRGGHMYSADWTQALSNTHEVELLGKTEMQSYFPTSSIWFERVVGVPKSMVAIRR